MDNHVNNQPLVSIVTISYNKGDEIEETIKSVVNQSYSNIEYIVIDGGSKDMTVEILKKYDARISKWVSEPDKGIYNAMNKGINFSTGEWIMFINSGDKLADDEIITKMMAQADSSSDIVYGDIIILTASGAIEHKARSAKRLKHGMSFGHPSSIIKNSVMKEELYDEQYKLAADYNFFYQSYKKGRKFQHIPIVVSVFEGITGASNINVKLTCIECAKIKGKYSFLWLIGYDVRVLWRKIKRKIKKS